MNSQIFRAYDIRGKYPQQINEKEVFDVALRLGAFFKKGTKIVIGHDARKSSPFLYRALYNGLVAGGLRVIAAGMIITPMIDFFVRLLGAGGGVVVTASHNPKYFNGLYIVDSSGANIGGREIYSKIKNLNPKITTEKSSDIFSNEIWFQKKYSDFISRQFSAAKNIKVVIDCSNGSAGPIIKLLKFPKNVKAVALNANPDGNFPAHGPDPTVKYAWKQAADSVIKNNADLGIVFDADGDRALVLDNKGREVISEHVWRMISVLHPQADAVYSVLSNFMLDAIKSTDESIDSIKFIEAKVGHLFMKNVCFKTKGAIGVETSMHYYLSQDYYAGSGVLAMVEIINALSRLPYSLAEFVSMMPYIARIPEYNISMDKKNLPKLYKNIHSMFKKDAKKFGHLDGLSVFGKDWWFNIRPSNTEDLLRINIEAKNSNVSQKIKKIIIAQIKRNS